MESLLLAIAHARVDIPPDVLGWALDTATPLFRASTEFLVRRDVTDAQAWALLWRDGKLEKSAEKVSPGEPGYWSSNASSGRLAGHVASYLARPDVPPGTVARVRERFDATAMSRLDLLREVTRLGGSDAVCHELAAEPPVGSSRGHRLGPRELALVERYRSDLRTEAHERAESIAAQVSAILEGDGLLGRVECARARGTGGIDVLDACLFGHGSIAPAPESADAESAEWLEEVGVNALAYAPDWFRLGPSLSALRPIVRMHRDPADRSAQRWWPRRIRDFGPAGAVPLTFSLTPEEGDYVIRKLGNDLRRYEELAELAKAQPNVPLGELCCATEGLSRASGAGHPDRTEGSEHAPEAPDSPEPSVPDMAAIRAAWPQVMAEVSDRSRTTHVMLRDATVHQVGGHHIVLAHAIEPLATRLSVPRNSALIVGALQAVFGVEFEVSCMHVPRSEGAAAQPGVSIP
ncbi:hypothetical protein [Aldersonia kunmingensis]|uniref:hypothetical protein n=1 Tax=Aldersonia kunmingensis TaxID=408066 RepID=UPI00083722AD|nr:hypothetical protein [Aldersonia kunmingensis]